MKKSIAILCLFTAPYTYAQQPVDALVKAEKDFAALGAATTTRNAFVQFLDTAATGFAEGRFINIYDSWKARPADSTRLTWGPQFSIISASGDLGINAGPWEFRVHAADEPAVAHGYFVSVWKNNPGTGWRVMFDQGIGYPLQVQSAAAEQKLVSGPAATGLPLNPEQDFIADYASGADAALARYMHEKGWVLLEGHVPFTLQDAVVKAAARLPQQLVFTPQGQFRSAAGDLLAVYGTATEGSNVRPYLRVWSQASGQWKLALMMLAV